MALGIDREEVEKLFSKDLLNTSVYASSFLKFFQENLGRLKLDGQIPAEDLPSDFVNPYEDSPKPIGQRLSEIGVSGEDKTGLFDEETLKLNVNGEEFSAFLANSKTKLLGSLEKTAIRGDQNASKS